MHQNAQQFLRQATLAFRDEFPPDAIKALYHHRWDEESSFRDLKYTIDLVHFHCKKREYVEQEAWARLIVYNFCEAIARHIVVTKQSGKNTKHDYKINFATAACICKAYLKRNDDEINVCRLIGRFLIPIRPNRSAPRKIKPQSAKSFLYLSGVNPFQNS
ncbi:MAG: transposase [Lachnospiraceae bacterium]|nr:transposase [Lachnospiraceae bacterium]